MSSSVNLKALGINSNGNQLELTPGTLAEATNVIINRNNVIEKRRGFKLYGNAFGSSTQRAKQLFQYRDQLMMHYSNILRYDNGSGLFTDFPGNYLEPQAGIRIKSVAANNNFYFTTDQGIKKIASVNSNLGNSVISNSGGIKAIDIEARLNYQYGLTTGFLPVDSAVAYRAVWGIKDVNNNLILGTPSQRAEIYNPYTPILIEDMMYLLRALDSVSDGTGTLDDGDYVSTLKLPITAAAVDVRNNLISLASKIDDDIFTNPLPPFTTMVWSVGPPSLVTITYTSPHGLNVGDKIEITNAVPSGYNGKFEIAQTTSTTLSFNLDTDPGTYISGATVRHIKYGFINQSDELSPIPTDEQLVSLQDYMENIITTLQSEDTTVISAINLTKYIDPLSVTKSSTTFLDITIPQDVINAGLNEYFFQIYRSDITQATDQGVLADLIPDDEMRLVYEAFPTAAELLAGKITVEDVTPDAFAGANLYTNEATGEGALQSNDAPPFAIDLARFKNVIFYANTRTKHNKLISLLGVTNMITDYDNGVTPQITITNGTVTVDYAFVTGTQQSTDFTTVADVADSLNGKYFDFYNTNDFTVYRFYYKTSGGTDTPPAAPTNGIVVPIEVPTGATAIEVASKTSDIFNTYAFDFASTSSTNSVTVLNVNVGDASDMLVQTSGFTIVSIIQGRGQNSTTTPKQVLLSSNISPAQAVDETARSLVNIINTDPSSPVYAFYLSNAGSVPGQIELEAKDLNINPFYILANNENTGKSFNPDISPISQITGISSTNPAQITTSVAHGLSNGDKVVIAASNSPVNIDGLHEVIVTGPTTFTINLNLSAMAPGSYTAAYSKTSDVEVSENDEKPNRIYYSKLDQPEAVPISNFFDVGDSDKGILRIFPLRDSLFVFKEEGLYRVSGENAPFNLALFDSSCRLIAPDSLGVTDNVIFAWTKQGIQTVSESGVSLISKEIDNDIKKLASDNYPNFNTLTWGVGYESDNAYLVWTVQEVSDQEATICFRYDTKTGTWVNYDKTNTCGILKLLDNKLYLGAGDTDFIEQERKSYTRLDYADRESNVLLENNNYFGANLKFSVVTNIDVGDVFVQEQTLTVYEYNMLLKKLDFDPGPADKNYYSTLVASAGVDLRTKLVSLAIKLDADANTQIKHYASDIADLSGNIGSQTIGGSTVRITSPSHGLLTGRYVTISNNTSIPSLDGTWKVTVIDANTFSIPEVVMTPIVDGTWITPVTDFLDLQGCYNILINNLNSDQGIDFSNYQPITSITLQEAIVNSINPNTKVVTLNLALEFVVGNLILYKAFESTFTYSPITMGDPLGYKHLREATMMFDNKAFTRAELSFSSDLLPEYTPVPFNGDGNGIFGNTPFGNNFFGGASHNAPFRTLVPRPCQRCRYLNMAFSHKVARENVIVYGSTVTGEIGFSERPYRS